MLAATEGPDEADCDLVAVGGTFRIQCVATCATTTNYSYSLVKPDGEVLTRETREFELRVSGGSDGGTYICYCSWSDGDVGGRSDGERHCVLGWCALLSLSLSLALIILIPIAFCF